MACNSYLSVAARTNYLSRSVPEIHSHVSGTLSNQPTNKPLLVHLSHLPVFSPAAFRTQHIRWISDIILPLSVISRRVEILSQVQSILSHSILVSTPCLPLPAIGVRWLSCRYLGYPDIILPLYVASRRAEFSSQLH